MGQLPVVLQAFLDLFHLLAIVFWGSTYWFQRKAHNRLTTDEDSLTTDEDSLTPEEDPLPTQKDSLPTDESQTENAVPPKPILFLADHVGKSIRQQLDVECRLFHPFFKVYPRDEIEELWILTILEAERVGYFRHNNVHNFKVVIRGLPVDTKPDTIHECLTDKGFPVIKVVQMSNMSSGTKLPLFLVHLSDKCEDMFNLTRLDDKEISVEKYRRRWVRCFSCQLYGHTSNNCHMGVRCMYCGLGHKSSTCAIRKYPSMYRCIHCGGPHECSSLMCPVRPRTFSQV